MAEKSDGTKTALLIIGGLTGAAALLEAVALSKKALAAGVPPSDEAIIALLTAIGQAVTDIDAIETDILNAVKAISVPSGGVSPVVAAEFLMNPPKVLALIETASPSDCDTSPTYTSFQLSAGQTLVITQIAPANKMNILAGGIIYCDTPQAISATLKLDGKPRITIPSGPAMAGMYQFPLYGYNACSDLEYTVTNNHIASISITIIGFGASLSLDLWNALKAQIAQIKGQLFPP